MGPYFLGVAKVLLLAQAFQGTIAGSVWDGETAEPVPGAVVTLTDLNRAVTTDDSGRYELCQVPAGDHPITVRLVGYATRTLHALVPENGPLVIHVQLVPDPVRVPAVDVHAPLAVRGLDRGAASAFPDRVVSAAAMRSDPLLAEPDAMEAFAGGEVSLRQESSSGVNIRGGASDQTAYLLDGIPIFNPYHSGGVSCAWNPDALSGMRLSSTTPPEGSASALSGTIEGTTREPGDHLRVQGSASTTQSRLTVDGPLGGAPAPPRDASEGARAGYLVSLRFARSDGIAPKQEPTYIRGAIGDWLSKLVAPVLGGRLEVLAYGNQNDLNTAAMVTPDGDAADPRRNTFEWTGRSLGAQWSRVLANTAVHILAWGADGDARSDWAAGVSPLHMFSARHDQGLLVGARQEHDWGATVAELRLERSHTSYRVASDSASAASWTLGGSTPVATAVARQRLRAGTLLLFDLGATVAATRGEQHVGSNGQLTWLTSNRLSLSGSYARTHQFEQSLRNAESVVGNVFPADLWMGAGAPGVPIAHSRTGVLSAIYRLGGGLRVSIQAYARRSDGLLLVAPSDGGPFASSGFTTGSAVSRGVSGDVAWRTKGFAMVGSYGLQRVRFSHGGSSYVPEIGATHLLRWGLITFPSPSTSVRVGLTGAMGRRATAVTGGLEWEANNILDRGSEFGGSPQYSVDALGETALPAYCRLDLGVRKEWRVAFGGRDGTLALFGTATNLLGRKNVLTYAMDPSTGHWTRVQMRPRAPLVVGLDWGF